jgi:hypothetical protein
MRVRYATENRAREARAARDDDVRLAVGLPRVDALDIELLERHLARRARCAARDRGVAYGDECERAVTATSHVVNSVERRIGIAQAYARCIAPPR